MEKTLMRKGILFSRMASHQASELETGQGSCQFPGTNSYKLVKTVDVQFSMFAEGLADEFFFRIELVE